MIYKFKFFIFFTVVERLKGVKSLREYLELKKEVGVRFKENSDKLEKLARKEGLSIYKIPNILLWRHLQDQRLSRYILKWIVRNA